MNPGLAKAYSENNIKHSGISKFNYIGLFRNPSSGVKPFMDG